MVDWPHSPLHRFDATGLYFLTAGTYLKRHYYRERSRLDAFLDRFFALARDHSVALQAWAIFSNHYHLVAHAAGASLRRMVAELHSLEARACNAHDNAPGRKVWFQCRDTQLTYERSWIARLRYTHENPVKHGLVGRAIDYPWCSASWFERVSTPAFVESLRRVKTDRVNVPDDFEPC